MSDNPMAAALARLHAEHPDLPTDGGRVWEPVQDEAEAEEAPTPLDRAEQAAPADRAAILREAANALACLGPEDSLVSGPKAWNEAVETLRRMADEAQQCRTPSPDGMHTCVLEPEHDGLHADKPLAAVAPNGSRMVWETPVVRTPCSVPNPCEDGELCDRHEVEQAHAEGEHELCGVTCEVQFPTELMRNFILAKGYPGTTGMLNELLRRAAEGQPAPADTCQFHGPAGDPCDCGCDAAADCHPNPRRTA